MEPLDCFAALCRVHTEEGNFVGLHWGCGGQDDQHQQLRPRCAPPAGGAGSGEVGGSIRWGEGGACGGVGGGGGAPPGNPELLEAPKAPKKFCGVN